MTLPLICITALKVPPGAAVGPPGPVKSVIAERTYRPSVIAPPEGVGAAFATATAVTSGPSSTSVLHPELDPSVVGFAFPEGGLDEHETKLISAADRNMPRQRREFLPAMRRRVSISAILSPISLYRQFGQ